MATKTSGEIEKEFIDHLKTSTGRDLKDWMTEINTFVNKKRNDIIHLLKTEYNFGHMNASLLAGIFLNNGKPVYGDTSELLENQFTKAPSMWPLYQAFIELVQKNFPEAAILPKKTYVSVLGKREFAAINVKPKELRIGLDLGDRLFDETVTKARLTGPMPRISHQIILTTESQLNDELVKLLQDSYSRSCN